MINIMEMDTCTLLPEYFRLLYALISYGIALGNLTAVAGTGNLSAISRPYGRNPRFLGLV